MNADSARAFIGNLHGNNTIVHTDTGKVMDGYTVMLCGKIGGKWGSPNAATCPDCLSILAERYVLYTGE